MIEHGGALTPPLFPVPLIAEGHPRPQALRAGSQLISKRTLFSGVCQTPSI